MYTVENLKRGLEILGDRIDSATEVQVRSDRIVFGGERVQDLTNEQVTELKKHGWVFDGQTGFGFQV